jgi:hypothetical protein
VAIAASAKRAACIFTEGIEGRADSSRRGRGGRPSLANGGAHHFGAPNAGRYRQLGTCAATPAECWVMLANYTVSRGPLRRCPTPRPPSKGLNAMLQILEWR